MFSGLVNLVSTVARDLVEDFQEPLVDADDDEQPAELPVHASTAASPKRRSVHTNAATPVTTSTPIAATTTNSIASMHSASNTPAAPRIQFNLDILASPASPERAPASEPLSTSWSQLLEALEGQHQTPASHSSHGVVTDQDGDADDTQCSDSASALLGAVARVREFRESLEQENARRAEACAIHADKSAVAAQSRTPLGEASNRCQ